MSKEFKEFKVDAGNMHVDRKDVQQKLLDLGYTWKSGETDVLFEAQYLYCSRNGILSYTPNTIAFSEHRFPIGTVETKTVITIVPQAFLLEGNYTVGVLKLILANLEEG